MPYLMNYQAEEHNVLHEMSNLEYISDDVYLLANEHYVGTSNYTPPPTVATSREMVLRRETC